MTTAQIERTIEAEKHLGEQLEEFAGEWVAIEDQRVVAHAPSLGELLEQESLKEESEATIFQVPNGKAAACFF